MSAIQTLTCEKDDALRKLARAEFTCDSYQDRLNSADKKINELQKATVRVYTSQCGVWHN